MAFKRLEGIPPLADRGARLLLLDEGRMLAVADGPVVNLFELSERGEYYAAARVAGRELQDRVQAIAALGHGTVVVASPARRGSRLQVLDRAGLRDLAELPGRVTEMTTTRRDVVVATTGAAETPPQLTGIDRRSGTVRWTRALPDAHVTLRPAPDGRSIVVVDARRETGRRVRPEEDCGEPRPYPPQDPERPRAEPSPPCECHGGEEPRDAGQPGRPAGHKRPDRTPEDPDCRPGTDWAPGECDDWLVQGALVARYPRCTDEPPCKIRLDFRVAKLMPARQQIVAMSEDGGRIAVLDGRTLRTHHARSLGRGGALLAVARDSTQLIAYRWGLGWGVLDLVALPEELGPIELPALTAPASSITFHGHNPDPLPPTPAPQIGTKRVLAVPLVEPGQSFTDPNLAAFAAFMQPQAFDVINDYYDEVSFGQIDVLTELFGFNAGPAGKPIEVPRMFRSYFHPPFVPGGLSATEASGTNPYTVRLDGSEELVLHITPRVRAADDLTVPFCAIGFIRTHNLFPVSLTFGAAASAEFEVQSPSGSTHTLELSFPPTTITIGSSDIAGGLANLRGYLESVVQAAETAAGVPAGSLFASVEVRRIKRAGNNFGDLDIRLRMPAGAQKGRVSVTSQTNLGVIGFDTPMRGDFGLGADGPALRTYLVHALRAAEADAGYDFSNTLLGDTTVAFASATGTVTTVLRLSDDDGGAGASISVGTQSGMGALGFDDATPVPGESSKNKASTLRDSQDLLDDVFSAMVDRLGGSVPAGFFDPYISVLLCVVGAPPAGEWGAAQPDISGLRMFARFRTAVYRDDDNITLQNRWIGTVLGAVPDNPITAHEIGHALDLPDLYWETGYRDELQYMEGWAMMDAHPGFPHFCGYHKYVLGWVAPERVVPVDLPSPAGPTSAEALLVPIEHWDSGMEAAVRAAFGGSVPVAQLMSINLGGDGVQFDLIEARQAGLNFSRSLPGGPGLLVSNAIDPQDDTRYGVGGLYRRKVHRLNAGNDLRAAGDMFDLAAAPELAAVGVAATVVDVRDIVRPYGTVKVFHTRIDREQADYVDLAFTETTPIWKSPDIWVDWAGDNPSTDPVDHRVYAEGTPLDQGEPVRYPSSGSELHWVVARVHNRGTADALNVKVNAYKWDPPGAGDTGKKAMFRSGTIDLVPAGGWVTLPLRWDITPVEKAHQCLRCDIADWTLPQDPGTAVALASDDVWLSNNWAQQNVFDFVAVSSSPYAPLDFRFSVTNEGVQPERAYLEPEGLPVGMRLTVSPRTRVIQPGEVAIFRCRLELDHEVIDAGCRNDREWILHAWRETGEAFERWGGCKYTVRPRHGVEVDLGGWWPPGVVHLDGAVTPDPGGGRLMVRSLFEGGEARWHEAPLQPGGTYTLDLEPEQGGIAEFIAYYEGSDEHAPAYSPVLLLAPILPAG